MTANGGTKIPDRAPAEQADVTIVVLVCEEVAGVGPRYHGCSLNRVCAMGILSAVDVQREEERRGNGDQILILRRGHAELSYF